MARDLAPLSTGQQIQPLRTQEPWLIVRLARWLLIATRLVVVWWPLAPLWLALVTLGPLGALVVILLTGSVLALSATARRWATRQVRVCVSRSWVVAWRAAWPWITGLAGLTYVLANRTRVPALVSVEPGVGWWPQMVTLRVRPLGAHDPNTWDSIEDRLARVTKHAGSLSWFDTETGALVIRLFRRPLPTFIPAPIARLAARERVVVLGVSSEGDPIRWAIDARPHATIVGETGGGKGVLLRLLLAHAVVWGWEVRVLNPKRSGEYGWLRHRASIAKTLDGMAAMVADTYQLMQSRQDLIEAAGADTWHHVDDLDGRVLLILDESASLIGTGNKGDDAALRRVIAGQLAAIVAMGRSAGVHVVMVTQHGVADSFGPSGSTMKANTGARVVVGNAPPEGLRMMFGNDLNPALGPQLAAGIPGRCLYQGLDPAKRSRVTVGQVFYATQADMTGLPDRSQVDVVVRDFDTEATATDDVDDERGGVTA